MRRPARVLFVHSLLFTAATAQSPFSPFGDEATEVVRARNRPTPDGDSFDGCTSDDGTVQVLVTRAGNQTVPATNGSPIVLLRRLPGGTVAIVNQNANAGGPADGAASAPSLSRDGRWVGFASTGTNLVVGLSNPAGRVLAYASNQGVASQLASGRFGSATVAANADCTSPCVDKDGRLVFASRATDLVAGVATGIRHIYLWQPGVGIVLVSRQGSTPGNGDSDHPRLTDDGRYVVYESLASNLDPTVVDGNGVADVYLWDRLTGVTALVSRVPGIGQSSQPCTDPSVSDDGLRIVCRSRATEFGHNATGEVQAFLFDLASATASVVSRNTLDQGGNQPVEQARISADGRRIAFTTAATDLGLANPGLVRQVWLREYASDRLRLVSTTDDRRPAARDCQGLGISGDGVWITFDTADALDPVERDGVGDVYLGFGGLSGHAQTSSGPGLLRGLRPSRLLQRTGLSTGELLDVHALTAPCAGTLLVTGRRVVNGTPQLVHGTVDCTGAFTADASLANVPAAALTGLALSPDGLVLVATTAQQTLFATRPTLAAAFPAPVATSLGALPAGVRLSPTPGVGTAPFDLYHASATDAQALESIAVCMVQTAVDCILCQPPVCVSATRLQVGSLPGLDAIGAATPMGSGPTRHDPPLWILGRAGSDGAIHFATAPDSVPGRGYALFRSPQLAVTAGSPSIHSAFGRQYVQDGNGRAWEFETLTMNSVLASATASGTAAFQLDAPADWLDEGLLAAVGIDWTTNGGVVVGSQLGTPLSVQPFTTFVNLVPTPHVPPVVGVHLPANLGPLHLYVQGFVLGTASGRYAGSNVAELQVR